MFGEFPILLSWSTVPTSAGRLLLSSFWPLLCESLSVGFVCEWTWKATRIHSYECLAVPMDWDAKGSKLYLIVTTPWVQWALVMYLVVILNKAGQNGLLLWVPRVLLHWVGGAWGLHHLFWVTLKGSRLSVPVSCRMYTPCLSSGLSFHLKVCGALLRDLSPGSVNNIVEI